MWRLVLKRKLLHSIWLFSHLLVVVFPDKLWPQSAIQPRIQYADLQYLGAFRVPNGSYGDSRFGYGGTALAFNPINNSLFVVGHNSQQQVAEISIPVVVNNTDIEQLNFASVLQNFADVTDGLRTQYLPDVNGSKVGGLLVDGNRLVWSAFEYYDGASDAQYSHGLSGLNLADPADAQGMYRVGKTINPGFVGGYMCDVPDGWQDEFGAPYLTGQAAIPIINRSSAGPAAFGFNPDDFGTSPSTAIPLVYYPISHPLATVNEQNPFFNLSSFIEGILFPNGYRSVIFWGRHGTGPYCYGEGADCGDPVDASKGNHAYPYIYQAWVYDVLDLLEVKNGIKEPWTAKPYAIWQLDLPYEVGNKRIGGVAYDEQGNRVFISQMGADTKNGEPKPVIHVYKIAPPKNNLNPPSGFNLISPQNEIFESGEPIGFSWQAAKDPDSNAVSYKLDIVSAGLDTAISGLPDTSITLTINDLTSDSDCSWFVTASDGVYETRSLNTLTFTIKKKKETTSSVNDVDRRIEDFSLRQNYPNPFNPITRISYTIPKSGHIALKVFNTVGNEVLKLADNYQNAGLHSVAVDGRSLPSGTYYYVLYVDGKLRETKKMLLLK